MSRINDGKYLEDAVKAELDKIKDADFRYRRLPDAKAARGLISAQPSDFMLAEPDHVRHLECKSVGGKTMRLPSFSQWAEMRAWHKAGVEGLVLIHFHVPDVFCICSVGALEPAPSWSFKDVTTYRTVNETLRQVLGDRLPA